AETFGACSSTGNIKGIPGAQSGRRWPCHAASVDAALAGEAIMPKMSGPRFVAETLRGYGVTYLFFVPQMLLDTLTAMEGTGVRRIMTHGEKSAAYMADGYARASGKPGVCMAQHVGASNLAAGLKDAYLAASPVIAITGGPAPLARYRHAYQELEDFAQFGPTTKFNAHVDHIARLPD